MAMKYRIVDQKCEHLTCPLGIDAQSPQLSWIYEGENDLGLGAQIRVVASLNEDIQGEALWDSGWKESALTAMHYEGPALKSGQRVYWKAMTCLSGRDETLAEAVSWFEMGLLRPEDWHGQWIRGDLDCQAPVLMRRFSLERIPERARVYICGLGIFELWVNGVQVGDELLQPVLTTYSRQPLTHMLYPYDYQGAFRTPYRCFDVSGLLREGENEFAVKLGNGWYHQVGRLVEGDLWYGEAPALLFEARMDETIVCSDENWQWRDSEGVFNNLFLGEQTDFTRDNFGEKPVQIAPAPDGALRAQSCPADAVAGEYEVERALCARDHRVILDFAQNMSGWVAVKAEARRGDRLELRFSEEIEPDGEIWKLQFESAGGEGQIQQDVFTFAGGGEACVRPRFCWHGFRYAEVALIREGKAVQLTFEQGCLKAEGFSAKLTAEFVTANHPVTGAFSCDNEILNWFHRATVMSLRSNEHCGVPLDCPHRERLGYTGDGQVTAQAILMNMDAAAFMAKWMRDILDAQNRKTGHVPHTAPFYNGGGGPGGWGGAVVFVPDALYKQTGDLNLVREAWPHMLKWMEYLDNHSQDGIVVREEEGGWCLGDWCTPEEIRVEPELVNTALTMGMLRIMARFADLLGYPEEKRRLERDYAQRRQAFRRAFFHPESASFGAGCQGSEALALWSGAVDEDEKPGVLKKILSDLEARGGRFDTGIFATPILLRVLSENGYIEQAFGLMTSTGYPSFDYMRQCGATTLFEHWHPDRGSHNHGMFGAADVWLYGYAAGIEQPADSAGWEKILFRPGAIQGLHSAQAELKTPLGRCAISWRRENGRLHVATQAPALARTEMVLPDGRRMQVASGAKEWVFELNELPEAAR